MRAQGGNLVVGEATHEWGRAPETAGPYDAGEPQWPPGASYACAAGTNMPLQQAPPAAACHALPGSRSCSKCYHGGDE